MNEIPGQAVRVGDLEVLGVPRHERRRPEWHHPYHGIARPFGSDQKHPLTRILDAEPLLPSCGCLGGWASMYLQGVPRLDGLDAAGRQLDVLLHTCERHRLVNRPGIAPTRTVLLAGEWHDFDGHRLTTIARAAYDEMCRAPNLTEAVVALDVAVSRVNGGARATIDAVDRLVARHKKTRGIRKARAAVGLASERSASQLETRTRLVAVPALPGCEFAENRPTFNRHGQLLGIPDLLDVRSGLVIESDGAQHGSVDGRSSDHEGDDTFATHGLTVARVTPAHHRNRSVLIARLRTDLRRARERHAAGPPKWTLDEPEWWKDSPLAARWG